ncbi:hypothetical protein CONCODRAFT_79801 [Conidiobolus coronatus NRRL 28638]|uniref:Uncharacterized protein n=1 Tax=Conidiobolus coronatus (strain ATCC 28846 / CBS 209.66 / NRRL 28638) TaxID=796925 RepID=A0A137P076_CONC2|nr:hypothetical protein CONCODRAFT_79801 [Conidiobolus coronatus NRRL 28638]|eukprot:KXN68311.1 hypothetical protein CONCODRAFT_79801 [Conidiobolus coronatus NRRL 28638]
MQENSNSILSSEQVNNHIDDANSSIEKLLQNFYEFQKDTDKIPLEATQYRQNIFIELNNIRASNRLLCKDLEDKEKSISLRKNKYNDKRRELLLLYEDKKNLQNKITSVKRKHASVDNLVFISEEDLKIQAGEEFEAKETDVTLKRLKFELKIRSDASSKRKGALEEKGKLEQQLKKYDQAIKDLDERIDRLGDKCGAITHTINKYS